MPGLNKQDPLGAGPTTGQQRGMCKRTEDLPLRGGGAGRGISRRRRLSGQPGYRLAQNERRFTQAEEPAKITSQKDVEKKLGELKKQYQEASGSLTKLAKEIKLLETKFSNI
jgi:hypothetical protein